MFTDFENKINPDFLKWEKAISLVEEMCDARIAYYRELERFFREATSSELVCYYQSLRKIPDTLHYQEKNCDEKKKRDVEYALYRASIYAELKSLIVEKLPYQEMIDELHFSLFLKHGIEKETESHVKNKAVFNGEGISALFESRFLEGVMNAVSPLVSRTQIDFMKDHVFEFKETHTSVKRNIDRKAFLLNKCEELKKRVNDLYGKVNKKEIDFELLSKENLENILDAFNELKQIILDMDSKWFLYCKKDQNASIERLRYRELHRAYFNVLEATEELEKYIELATPDKGTDDYLVLPQPKKSTLKKSKSAKRGGKKKAKPKSKQKTRNREPVVLPVAAVESTVATEVADKITEEVADSIALRTQAWKEEVALRKKEKQNAVDRKSQEEREYLEAQKKEKQDYLFHKEERDYQNARQLLEKLNPRNLALIEHMFKKPTPHCEIRYHDIEELFGQEPGKLPGAITSVSGSHRKIVIQNTIGFFDELSIPDNADTDTPPILTMYQGFQQKQENHEVVGGTFKAHRRGQGGSKLPSIAIKLVCSAFERVGITAANIERYRKRNTVVCTETVSTLIM